MDCSLDGVFDASVHTDENETARIMISDPGCLVAWAGLLSAAAYDGEDGKNVTFLGFYFKLGVSRVYHENTHLFSVNVKRIHNITYCGLGLDLPLFNVEAVVPKVSEQFYSDFH
jgi:hypothetical protein